MASQEAKARFMEPMLLQRAQSLPEGPEWSYEVKLDGYRALLAWKTGSDCRRAGSEKHRGRTPMRESLRRFFVSSRLFDSRARSVISKCTFDRGQKPCLLTSRIAMSTNPRTFLLVSLEPMLIGPLRSASPPRHAFLGLGGCWVYTPQLSLWRQTPLSLARGLIQLEARSSVRNALS